MIGGNAAWFAFEECETIKMMSCQALIEIRCNQSAIGLYRFFSRGEISQAEHQLLLGMICTEEKRCTDFLSQIQISSDGYGFIDGKSLNQEFFDSLK